MGDSGRTPDHQAEVDAHLARLKSSAKYPKTIAKIREGKYRTDTTLREKKFKQLNHTFQKLKEKPAEEKTSEEAEQEQTLEELMHMIGDPRNIVKRNADVAALPDTVSSAPVLSEAAISRVVPSSMRTTSITLAPAPAPAPAPAVAASVLRTTVPNAKYVRDCHELFDPCTREPIADGDITILEKRVRDIKRQRMLDISDKIPFPDSIKNRLDLLLFILNRAEKPDETLLQYTNNGQLYESYWDIVFSLGLIDSFPKTNDFYMFNGKIETLVNIDGEGFSNNPLVYLQSKKVNEGSKSGASDITFVYKKNKSDINIDLCSSDPSIKVLQSCMKTPSLVKASAKETPQFFFCSSKYFNADSTKGVDKFDIQNIYTAAKSLNQEYNRKIILLVKDKGTVEEKLRKAIRKYISEEASYVYGIDDLFAALTFFYDSVRNQHKSTEALTVETLKGIINLESTPKPFLRLRLHQYLATYKICDAIQRFHRTGGSNKFLVGIVPRGGKTFIAGGIIDTLQPKRVVVLLGAKSETLSQFKKDLFEEFQNFADYICVDVVNTTDMTIDPSKKYIFIMSVELYKQVESTRRLLIDLKGRDKERRADLFICDEAHLKQTTARAVKQMERGTTAVKDDKEEEEVSDETEKSELKQLDDLIRTEVPVPVVYMTGTYIKPLTALKIPAENVIIWDYQDIQQAKELSTNEGYFKENFGELYEKALATCVSYGQTYETIQQQYQKFPELYLLTTQFTPEAKDAFFLEKQPSGGFPTISHLFEVKKDFNPEATPPERWYTGFTNPGKMLRLLNYLSPPTQAVKSFVGVPVEPIPVGPIPVAPISSVLKSVDTIAQRIGDRLGFFTSDFVVHSQLWFLPHMQGHPLYKRMCALVGAIFQSSWFRKYFHIIGVSSSVKWAIPGSEQSSIQIRAPDGSDSCGTFSWACPTGEKSLKQCLIDQEALARQKGKGLIILAQNMLHLGISLPCVDIVVLLDTGEKLDERIQKMYRALTESTNKKGGYIIDMNYFRTVTAIMNYQIQAEESRKGKKMEELDDIKRLFNKVLDIFSIDDDKHILRAEIVKETLPELQKLIETGKGAGDSIILEDAGTRLNLNIKNVLENNYKSSYAEFLGLLREEEEKQRTIREEGANVRRAEHTEEVDESRREESSYPEQKIFKADATEKQKREAYIDVFKTTLKLGAFGTDSTDIATLENKLSTDEELRQTLYETLIKRGAIQEDTINPDRQLNYIIDVMILPGLKKMIEEGKNGSYIKMKETIDDEEKYPAHVEKVLDYIKEHLTPKAAERHKFGEVFTPMTLVNDMLDTLPTEVWNDKTLKWLDPANGMGNFPIGVFLRLFYGFRTKEGKYVGIMKDGEGEYNPGLTTVIPGEEARRKHIVKDILFMVELNSKNNTIARNLFKKLAPGIEANIIQMHRTNGFLADVEMKFPNGTIGEFDIVMGNPPFQGGAVRGKSTNKTRKMRIEMDVGQDKHTNLWIPFVKKVLSTHLKKNGYLLFIHPIGWFKPDRAGIHEEMLKYQIKEMRIYDMYQSMKVFSGKGKISVAYYLLQNQPVSSNTTITDRLDKRESIKLLDDSIIILAFNSVFYKIQQKAPLFYLGNDHRVSSIPTTKCLGGHNKQIHKISESGEITFVKTSIVHKDQHIPKVYLSGYHNPRYYHDEKGEYGIIGSHQHYFVGDELNKLEDYFKTKLSTVLLKHIKYDQEYIEPKYYPDVRTLPLEKINDETLADYFGFTKEERDAINASEYPKREYKFKEITCAQLKKEEVLEGGARRRRFTRKIRRS